MSTASRPPQGEEPEQAAAGAAGLVLVGPRAQAALVALAGAAAMAECSTMVSEQFVQTHQ